MIVVTGDYSAPKDAYNAVSTAPGECVAVFLGDPWPVESTRDDVYDTRSLIAQLDSDGATLTPGERVLAHAGLNALLEFHAAARAAFPAITPLTHADGIRALAERLK